MHISIDRNTSWYFKENIRDSAFILIKEVEVDETEECILLCHRQAECYVASLPKPITTPRFTCKLFTKLLLH